MHGANPNIVDDSGYAALHHAICRGNLRVVSKLLEYNVDMKAKTKCGLTPYKLALFENQLEMAQFLIDNGADAHSELTPYSPPHSSARRATRVPCPVRRPRTTHLQPGLVSGGAAAVESEQSMKTCANSKKEENFSTDIMPSCSAVRPARQLKSLLKKSFLIKRASRRPNDQISLSEGTITREPEQRKEKCVTFNDEIHYNTDKKPFCSGVRPSGELKSILKKSLQISGASRRPNDQISLSEGTITREPEQRKEKCVTFNDEIHYNTDKKPFCSGVRPSGELKSILKKSLQISGDNGRNQDQISLGRILTTLPPGTESYRNKFCIPR
ncbi:uncharacterized protein LOC121435128 isoform X2 [Microtus oregoni]|nr:uncharacterized protein LOC121435128 isoform X2 [Microtus oregoni]